MEAQTREETNEEVEMEQSVVSLDEFNALKAKLEAQTERERKQGINSMLKDMVNQRKTTPAKAEAARVILSALTAAESDVVELSDDGSAAVRDDEVGKALVELMAPASLPEEGERGTTDLDTDLSDEDKLDRRANQLAVEKGIDYGQALDLALAEVN